MNFTILNLGSISCWIIKLKKQHLISYNPTHNTYLRSQSVGALLLYLFPSLSGSPVTKQWIISHCFEKQIYQDKTWYERRLGQIWHFQPTSPNSRCIQTDHSVSPVSDRLLGHQLMCQCQWITGGHVLSLGCGSGSSGYLVTTNYVIRSSLLAWLSSQLQTVPKQYLPKHFNTNFIFWNTLVITALHSLFAICPAPP